VHSSCYPKSALKDDMDDDSDDSDMKTFLLAGRAGYRLDGVVLDLQKIASDENLTVSQRKTLMANAGCLTRVTSEAKALKAKQEPPAEVETKLVEIDPKTLSELEQRIAALKV